MFGSLVKNASAFIQTCGRSLYNSCAGDNLAITHKTNEEQLLLQKNRSSPDELRPAVTKNRTVAGIRNDPEGGLWDGASHLNGQLDRIERIAIPLDDKRAGLNCGEKWRS